MNDGGPAFPVTVHMPYKKGTWKYGLPGLSLRDYFAGEALKAMGYDPNIHDPIKVAAEAYVVADEMLKARERK